MEEHAQNEKQGEDEEEGVWLYYIAYLGHLKGGKGRLHSSCIWTMYNTMFRITYINTNPAGMFMRLGALISRSVRRALLNAPRLCDTIQRALPHTS